jgi:hypothetical protein
MNAPKSWKLFVTFFQNLYDEHYTGDSGWDATHFGFVKVNDRFEMDLKQNKLPYNIKIEHDYPIFQPDFQEKGYCENSVIWHIYKNKIHLHYDYVGFIEYDHVLTPNFTEAIQKILDSTDKEMILSFQSMNFEQVFNQGILMNPRLRDKIEGNPKTPWNAVNVILRDYNQFYNTSHTLETLASKNCFPMCHALLIPSAMFAKIMPFHTSIMESGKVERYHRHNWRSPAGLMERYLAIALALEDVSINTSIQLEHLALPIKVTKPAWQKPTAWRRAIAWMQNKL